MTLEVMRPAGFDERGQPAGVLLLFVVDASVIDGQRRHAQTDSTVAVSSAVNVRSARASSSSTRRSPTPWRSEAP